MFVGGGIVSNFELLVLAIAGLNPAMAVTTIINISAEMTFESERELTFARLPDVPPEEILAHMSDVRVAEHMPLLISEWDHDTVTEFVAAKEEYWQRDGLGHWAILFNGRYVGWGGFQKEGDEWDYGLVLKPDSFGLGTRIVKKAIEFAFADERIPFVTFLLSPSRKNLGGLTRLGARFIGKTEHDGAQFLKFRLETR